MASQGFTLPQNRTYEDTVKFLTQKQFPVVFDEASRFFPALPKTGIYRHIATDVKDFMRALHETTGRDYTFSGVGSMIDYDAFGHQIKRPSPQLATTGCQGNSLCLEGTCFGFTEGVSESNNLIQNLCWDLSMPCLKDHIYSDMMFETKMKRYFQAFFQQPAAVAQAYQRTHLIKNSIKVLATNKNIRFTGPVIGGSAGIPLPFYINPVDETEMPNLNDLPAGTTIGGANLIAFRNYLAPRLFSGAFSGGMEGVKMYALGQDYFAAKEQTATVADSFMDQSMLSALLLKGAEGGDRIDGILGEFIEDGLFPTFEADPSGQLVPISAEVLEPSTIAGFRQTDNPQHNVARTRGILLVPNNWKYTLVEPPVDDFSFLGLGQGLNFGNNTPGVFPVIMSSSMFRGNTLGQDGQVIIGQSVGANGMIQKSVTGLTKREEIKKEAVRTELLMTYSSIACNNAPEGELPNVGRPIVSQGRADGFSLKSTMYIAPDVQGQARPVLVLFNTDVPRASRPIDVCAFEEVTVDSTSGLGLVSCCPGGKPYAILGLSGDASGTFAVDDEVIYRTGAKGISYLAAVTAVDGSVVSIEALDGPGGEPDLTAEIACCTGSPDDFGTRGEVFVNTGATATSSEIFKAKYDLATTSLLLELFKPVAATTAPQAGTLTLENGDVINIETVADAEGVFVQIEAAAGETCDLSTVDCGCLVNAVLALA